MGEDFEGYDYDYHNPEIELQVVGSGCFEFKCILVQLMGLVCILNKMKKTVV